MNKNMLYRSIPKVDVLLENQDIVTLIENHHRDVVVDVIREEIDKLRNFIKENDDVNLIETKINNLIENIKDKLDLLNDCILNVNIPNTKIKGSKITKLGQRNYDNAMVEKINPFGQKYYWIGGKLMELDQDEDSDIACVKDGYISITPINIEMTNLRKFELLKDIKMI